jgi:transketolase
MRDAFIAELSNIAEADPRMLLLAGDIGFKVFDRFRAAHGDRFINCGIAEANMIGMSAGLAMTGLKPFVYTIVPFLTMRAFEQIRVDLCMHDQRVVLVGVGGGLAYDMLGPTHHSIEDIALMRALPRMIVIVPCDPDEAKQAIVAAHVEHHPVYVRLGKNGEPSLGTSNLPTFEIGRARIMREGTDAGIVGCGPILSVALEAAGILEGKGISCRVVNAHTVKPLDKACILETVQKVCALVTIEEHSVIGGLGSAVAEVIAESGLSLPFRRFGIEDRFTTKIATQSGLLEYHGLTAVALAEWLASQVNGRLEKSNTKYNGK